MENEIYDISDLDIVNDDPTEPDYLGFENKCPDDSYHDMVWAPLSTDVGWGYCQKCLLTLESYSNGFTDTLEFAGFKTKEEIDLISKNIR